MHSSDPMPTLVVEEPILCRLERLDNVLKQLEAMRGGGGGNNESPKSSTASSSTTTAASSAEFSPKSLEKHCCPIDDVIMETEVKGTLIERLVNVEDRVAKLCMEFHQQLEALKTTANETTATMMTTTTTMTTTAPPSSASPHKSPKKGFKSFIKSCVKGKG